MDENRKEFYDKTGIDIDDRIKNVSGIPNFNSLVEYIKELENKIKNFGERSEPPHQLLSDGSGQEKIKLLEDVHTEWLPRGTIGILKHDKNGLATIIPDKPIDDYGFNENGAYIGSARYEIIKK